MKNYIGFVLFVMVASLVGMVVSACPKLTIDGPYVCQNGTPAAGLAPRQSETRCVACDVGYRLEGVACAANVYACENGTAAAGIPATDGAPRCAACNLGYRLLGEECVANRYFCANGVAKSGEAPVNYAPGCASCDSRYHLVERVDSAICEANAYVCPNGTPAGGLSVDRETLCAECDLGYHLENDACVENVHTCKNGTAKSGRPQTEYDQEFCVKCDATYALYNDSVTGSQTCAGTGYVCYYGTPTSGSPATAGTRSCVSCDRGFHLEGASCVANKYACSNGRAARGTPSSAGVRRCAECDVGYFLDGVSCRLLQGFGVSEYDIGGMTVIGDTLYMVGNDTDRLYTIDVSTGVATRVGTAEMYGVGKWRLFAQPWRSCIFPPVDSEGQYCTGEEAVRGLGNVGDQLYTVGRTTHRVYRLDYATGVASLVAEDTPENTLLHGGFMLSSDTTLYIWPHFDYAIGVLDHTTAKLGFGVGRRTIGLGVNEIAGSSGLTVLDGVVYMLGHDSRRLYTIDLPSGVATPVGTDGEGAAASADFRPRGLAAIDGKLYTGDEVRGWLYVYDLATGKATPVGGVRP